MGAIADTVLATGGSAIGVIPAGLALKEVAHEGLTELHVVDSMHARKQLMAELSDGFIALPGGLGTFEELFEVLTWSQLGVHTKPCGVLSVAGYFDLLEELIDQAVREGFLGRDKRALLMSARDPAQLLDRFQRWVPPPDRSMAGSTVHVRAADFFCATRRNAPVPAA